MILEYYTKIIQPYTKQLSKIFASKLRVPLGILIFFTGIAVIIFPKKLKSLLIFQHTSIAITTIAWYILSRKEHSHSSHFLFGSLCAQITYFVTLKRITQCRLSFFLVACLFYLPLICTKYSKMSDLVCDVVFCLMCLVCLLFCIYKVDLFIVTVTCFSGGCLASGICAFWLGKDIVCYESVLSAVLLCCFGVLLNYAVSKKRRKQKVYIERLDTDKTETIEK